MTPIHNWSKVNFRSMAFFEASMIADANELACQLGKYLFTTLIDWLDTWAIAMGKIAVKRGFEVPIHGGLSTMSNPAEAV